MTKSSTIGIHHAAGLADMPRRKMPTVLASTVWI